MDRIVALEDHVAHLQLALDNRPLIEHAVGMIMLLMPCTEDIAFAALRHVSQNTNRKLRDVAALITEAASAGRPLAADLMAALHEVMPPQVSGSGRRSPVVRPASASDTRPTVTS